MAATGTGLILLIAFGLCATGAVAQAQAVPPGLDRPGRLDARHRQAEARSQEGGAARGLGRGDAKGGASR